MQRIEFLLNTLFFRGLIALLAMALVSMTPSLALAQEAMPEMDNLPAKDEILSTTSTTSEDATTILTPKPEGQDDPVVTTNMEDTLGEEKSVVTGQDKTLEEFMPTTTGEEDPTIMTMTPTASSSNEQSEQDIPAFSFLPSGDNEEEQPTLVNLPFNRPTPTGGGGAPSQPQGPDPMLALFQNTANNPGGIASLDDLSNMEGTMNNTAAGTAGLFFDFEEAGSIMNGLMATGSGGTDLENPNGLNMPPEVEPVGQNPQGTVDDVLQSYSHLPFVNVTGN